MNKALLSAALLCIPFAASAQGWNVPPESQRANMVHPDGIESAIGAMKREGISDADIDLMMRKNPARLLGLN